MAVISESLQVSVEQDVPFGRAGTRDLLCDIYRPSPAVASKQTAVITLHGGAYRRGSKAGTHLARPLSARGYTCISASYRLADEAVWPAQLEDLKTCLRWVRSNAADLGVETSKIVLLG